MRREGGQVSVTRTTTPECPPVSSNLRRGTRTPVVGRGFLSYVCTSYLLPKVGRVSCGGTVTEFPSWTTSPFSTRL